MSSATPPLMESKKILASTRPPEAGAPSTRRVFRELGRVPPPTAVLTSFVMSTLVSLSLLVLLGLLIARVFTNGAPVWILVFFVLPLAGTLLILALLAWRGTKRLVHLGHYDGAFFIARLYTIFCLVAAVALVKLVVIDGEAAPLSLVVIPMVFVVLWAPAVLLARPAAKAWPDRVQLRWGVDVLDAEEARLLAAVRQHSCTTEPVLIDPRLVPVADESGAGWLLDSPCWRCGTRPSGLFRRLPADEQYAVGGNDWMYLVVTADKALEPVSGPDLSGLEPDVLAGLRFPAWAGVRATEKLLASIPEGRPEVPITRREGRSLPVFFVPDGGWARDALTAGLTRRRAQQQAVEHELTRRGG